MKYFLKVTTPSLKGTYLQIYKSFYIPGKGCRNSSFQKVGYVEELKKTGIEDPIAYYQDVVKELNKELETKGCRFQKSKSTHRYRKKSNG